MKHLAAIPFTLSILGTALCSPAVLAQNLQQCAALADAVIANTSLEITTAEHRAAESAGPAGGVLPGHCHVAGELDQRTGSDGRPYAIGFAVKMPDNWNGRFLFQGGGGLNGSIRPPVGDIAAGDASALTRGFAVVSTDSGHQGSGFDASFYADQEAHLNFLYGAIGKVTVVAKQLVNQYYQRPADHSYFVGCSTGGREAMIMSQRFPDYFDGIVAGAPAMRTAYSNLGLRWSAVALKAAPLAEGDAQLVVNAALTACDADDGVSDGMIFNIAACDFEPAEMVCSSSNSTQCLSAEKAAAVAKAMGGPRTPDGIQVYPGYSWDTGISASGQRSLPGILVGPPIPEGNPDPDSIDVAAEAFAASMSNTAVGETHNWTNLGTFSGHGGKLIFYHGVSDAWFSSQETTRYYQSLAPANGGMEAVNNFSKLYLVPGMGHCSGGDATLDRFDLLTTLVDWVENDAAPEAIVATGTAFPERSRPLCPYPEHAHYTGTGDSESAANFECRE